MSYVLKTRDLNRSELFQHEGINGRTIEASDWNLFILALEWGEGFTHLR